jgi:hypothetical protein
LLGWEAVLADLDSLHISSAFDPRSATIMLRGLQGSCTTTDLKKGKTLLANLIAESRPISLSTEETSAKNDSDRNGFHQRVSMYPQPELLALDPVQDAEVLKLWNMELDPRFPDFVQEAAIEGTYSVTLVRQNGIDGPQPIIRFRSSDNQGNISRLVIQDRVREVCKQYGHPVLKVQFTAGTLVRLVGSNSEEVVNDPSNDERFPHQRRYWERPGPGASIGLHGCPHTSATMGGHISVDGCPYMLSVDHFISQCPCRITTEVRSPSISDTDYIRHRLKQWKQNIELQLSRTTEHEIALDQVGTLFPRKVLEELSQIGRFEREAKQREHVFDLGTIRERSETRFRSSVNPVYHGVKHRLDYSLTEITQNTRQGKNILRHSRTADPSLEDLKREVLKPEGSGTPCTTTSDVVGGKSVFFVGRTSGLRTGKVNSALEQYRGEDGVVSREWAIVVPGCENLSPDQFEGDSGAWIFNDDDNSLVGMLWAWNNGNLLFTPIHDVFEDIKERWNARQVQLPELSLGSRPKPSGTLLCSTRSGLALDDFKDSSTPPIDILKTLPTGLLPLKIDDEPRRRRGSSASSGSSMSSTPGSVSSSSSSFTELSPPTPEGPSPFNMAEGLYNSVQLAFRTKPPPHCESVDGDWEIVRPELQIPDIALSPAAVQSAGE